MKELMLWKTVFGEDKTPNDCEIIGVENDGQVIFYNAESKSGYTNGSTVFSMKDDGEKFNEREHIVTHPFAYIACLRMQLELCKAASDSVGEIVDRALSADPSKYVNDLSKESEFIAMKKRLAKG